MIPVVHTRNTTIMKPIVVLSVFVLALLGCNTKNKATNPADYSVYLQPRTVSQNLSTIDAELAFWKERLTKVPDDIVSRSKLAGLLEKRFSYSGNIEELHKADSLFKMVNLIQSINSSGTFRALAANCIQQHKFQQGQLYIDSALRLGDNKYLSVLMEFDIAMELGHKYLANKALKSLVNKNNFDYLIRAAKYKDQIEGNLDEAIRLMEKALKEVENNESLALWTKSTLGDMYGHANRVTESYQCYLDVLSTNPEYYHVLKGIAWLAFSYDKNPEEARRIILFLQKHHPVPDYDLFLAEIAAYEKNETQKNYHLNKFLASTQNPMYGDMYNKYIFNLQADERNDAKAALRIAEKEVNNRPTPEAFSWLAWAYLKSGNIDKALQTARSHVERKSFEPEVVYRLGMIYKASGQKAKAKKYLTEAKTSSYELGPLCVKEITKALHSL